MDGRRMVGGWQPIGGLGNADTGGSHLQVLGKDLDIIKEHLIFPNQNTQIMYRKALPPVWRSTQRDVISIHVRVAEEISWNNPSATP